LTPGDSRGTLLVVPPRQDRDYEQAAAWGEIRDAAHDAFHQRGHTDAEREYRIAVAGVVLSVRSIAELAAVTRHERRRWGVRWPEDAR
jgi:hypothetical protein